MNNNFNLLSHDQGYSPGLSTVVLASKNLKLVVIHCSITLKINSEVGHETLVQLLTDSSSCVTVELTSQVESCFFLTIMNS